MEQTNTIVTNEILTDLAQAGHLPPTLLEKSRRLIGFTPSRQDWGRFLEILLLGLGALLLISGIFFFFAYNWDELPRFARFGVIEGLILVAAGAAHWFGLSKLTGKVMITLAALLVGALLAVFGQEYQTGADSYTLFLNWALLIAGWALIAAFEWLWLIVLALLNLALYFFWNQLYPSEAYPQPETLFALNALALLVWELLSQRGQQWMQQRWFPRLAGLAAYSWIVYPVLGLILTWYDGPEYIPTARWIAPPVYLLFLVVTLVYYSRKQRDLFLLTVAMLSLIIVVSTLLIRSIGEVDETLAFLAAGFVVIVQAALAVGWLRRVAKSWKEQSSTPSKEETAVTPQPMKIQSPIVIGGIAHPALSLQQLFDQLSTQQATPASPISEWIETLNNREESTSTPWYVSALVGISAWLAALMLGFFFGAAGLIDDNQSMMLWGGALCVTALAVAWWLGRTIFWNQLAFAFSLAGQALLIVGVAGEMEWDTSTIALFVAGFELVMLLIYPNALHRLISVLAIGGALTLWLFDQEFVDGIQGLIALSALGAMLLWQFESRLIGQRWQEMRAAIGYGLPLITFGLCIFPLAGLFETNRWWLSAIGLALVALYLAALLLTDLDFSWISGAGLGVLLALGLIFIPAYQTPGILAALIGLFLGYWRRSDLLLGLSILFLLSFLTAYYYNLDLTLLVKSYILMGSGALLLLLRVGLHQIRGEGVTT